MLSQILDFEFCRWQCPDCNCIHSLEPGGTERDYGLAAADAYTWLMDGWSRLQRRYDYKRTPSCTRSDLYQLYASLKLLQFVLPERSERHKNRKQ